MIPAALWQTAFMQNLCCAALLLVVGTSAGQSPWSNLSKPSIPAVGACSTLEPPTWLVDSFYESSPLERGAIMERLAGTGGGCHQQEPSVTGYWHPDPPTSVGPAVDIPRVLRRELPAASFYESFARPGLPVVLVGLGSDLPWWAEHAKRVVAAAQKDSAWNPEMENGWCSRCAGAASLDARRLREVLYVSAPSPELEALDVDVLPNSLWAHSDAEFGGPGHFDWHCEGTLSIQYHGSKKWTLWAPWDMGEVRTHSRFETVINESDAIWYPPGWFHETKVLRGLSVSVAHFTLVPTYGNLSDLSFWPTPFEACAAGRMGWRRRSAQWDTLIFGLGQLKQEL